MYTPGPTEAEAAAIGLTLEEAEGDPIGVWPDNAPAVTVFDMMGTQWRVSMIGFCGLDYSALPEVWRRAKIPPADRDRVFADVRVMELAALAQMKRNREAAQ